MPQYTIQDPKSGMTVTLEGDTPPSEQDIDQVFSSLSQQQAAPEAPVRPMDAAYMRAAAMAGGGGMVGGYPISGEQALRGAVTGGRLAMEGGGTAVAQGLGLAGGPAGPSIAGGTAARFLNMLGQGAEYAIYGKPFDVAENEKATLMGMVPIAGPEQLMAARAAQLGARSAVPGAIGTAVQTGGRFGAAGGASEVAVDLATKGEMPSLQQVAIATAAPFALGSAGEYLSQKGSTMIDRAAQAANALDFFKKANINPTPGMVDPRRFALMEQRMINKDPLGPLAQKQERAYEALSSGLYDVAPGKMQEATVFEQMKEKMAGIQQARQNLDRLGPEVAAAQKEADRALLDLNRNRDEYLKQVTETSDKALNEAVDGALKQSRQIQMMRTMQGPQAMSPDAARTEMVNKVIKPLDNAYDVHWGRMYAPFPNKEPLFDTTPILREAEKIYSGFSLKVPPALKSILSGADEEAGVVMLDSMGRPIASDVVQKGTTASLDALRNLRDMILKKGRIDASDPNLMEGSLRQFAGFISGQMDEQAPRVFGADMADQFRKVQADYKTYAELWKKPGLEMLFADNPTDEVVTKIVQGIEKSGSGADEFKNLRNLIANLAEPQTAKEVVQEGGQFMLGSKGSQVNPELAGRLAQHVNEVIRSNVLYGVSKNGKVEPKELISRLEKIGNDPEALRLLGFGTQDQVAEMRSLFSDYPLASKMSPDQWNELYASKTFQQALEKGGKLTDLLRPQLQLSELQNELSMATYMRNLGRLDTADSLYKSALDKARDLRISEAQLRARVSELQANPTYAVHTNAPVSPANYNELIRLTTDTSANAVTKEYLKSVAESLRNSSLRSDNELLTNWQAGYIRNQLMSGGGAQADVLKLSDLFGGMNRRGAAKEMSLARAILDDKQIEAIQNLGEAANQLRLYERGGSATKKRVTETLNDRGRILRGYDAMADMLLRRQYDQVAQALVNPDQYVNRIAAGGQWLQVGGETAKAIAPALSRFLPQQQQQQPNQPPSSIPQFLRR